MAKGKRTPEEVKLKTVQRLGKGEQLEDLAAELGVQPSTVMDWRAQFGKKAKRKVMTRKSVTRRNPLKMENEDLQEKVDFWMNKYTNLLYERSK